ncbi:hypothetical protein F383_34475 [Gossypium arboreum]|uniref:Uncharacterized protein n=1 Tax=Gossypium arboreum TaxID=29729 RepID=A0A0B0N7X1_GOSAR|nr:hypothetical protein F383_34475 [Gossypium arboreum]
MAKSSLVCKAM